MRARTIFLPLSLALAATVVTGCAPDTTPGSTAQTGAAVIAPPTPSAAAPAPSPTDGAARPWTVKDAAAITPLLTGRTVLTARTDTTGSTLLAVDAHTGATTWQARLDAASPADQDEHGGILKVVADDASGAVYAAWPTRDDDTDWTITAYDAATGTPTWTREDAPGVPLYATSTGVVVGTGFSASDAEVAEPTGTAMLARDTGSTAWTSDGTAPLAVSADAILASTGTDLAGVAGLDPATAKTRWTVTDPAHVVVAEAVADHRALVSLRDETGAATVARVIDTTTGQQVGADLSLPEGADLTARIDRDAQVALVADGTTLRGIALDTGKALWSRPAGSDPVSVAGAGLAWVTADEMVVDSRTGHPVKGVPTDGVVAAGAGVAVRADDAVTGTPLPPSLD